MKRASRMIVGSSVALAAAFVAPVSAVADEERDAPTPRIVAVAGSRNGTYATPVTVVERGEPVSFVNVDLFVHDVRSRVKGPDRMPWCGRVDRGEPLHPVRNPRRFPVGKCPLLWTPPIAVTNGVVESRIYGTQNLRSGTTIDFFCTVFPEMKGSVIVR
jgi:hypothetical protein